MTEIELNNIISLEDYRNLKLEELAIQSALNMGVPDYFICGQCGSYHLSAVEFENHIREDKCLP
jgi:hypothetical protein